MHCWQSVQCGWRADSMTSSLSPDIYLLWLTYVWNISSFFIHCFHSRHILVVMKCTFRMFNDLEINLMQRMLFIHYEIGVLAYLLHGCCCDWLRSHFMAKHRKEQLNFWNFFAIKFLNTLFYCFLCRDALFGHWKYMFCVKIIKPVQELFWYFTFWQIHKSVLW